MNILEQLLKLSEEESKKDFFHAMTQLSRIFAGYPQEYGFHHHCDKKEYHGTFATRDGRGKVFKTQGANGSAKYACEFNEDNLLDQHDRLAQVLDAVRASTPSLWNYVAPKHYNTDSVDPNFSVTHSKTPGIIDINVSPDCHPSIK
jgi:hypothetical protein